MWFVAICPEAKRNSGHQPCPEWVYISPDYHLESARLQLAQGNNDKAREHLVTAKETIERMGYHQRDKEVNGLQQQLDRD